MPWASGESRRVTAVSRASIMKLPRGRLPHLAAGAAMLAASNLVLALTSYGAWSQMMTTIKIVVPLPPGSGQDIMSRLLGEQISRAQGATVVIENRPGAGT